ncbi:hypothetical protein DPMN_191495 [Dreissena polymorpha]|uniref:Uncharacterized protein n=1 Tax=Dreissena polymorpha TaxID=45954 RepID=A0A9D3Y3A5_DREPO|nr:hypothetical protein DPMN_191495 [Dreissena polymorpha]
MGDLKRSRTLIGKFGHSKSIESLISYSLFSRSGTFAADQIPLGALVQGMSLQLPLRLFDLLGICIKVSKPGVSRTPSPALPLRVAGEICPGTGCRLVNGVAC